MRFFLAIGSKSDWETGSGQEKGFTIAMATGDEPAKVFFFHCLISDREGLGTSLQIMGLATIDPHSLKAQTKLYKIPKFGVNRPKSQQDTAI